MKIHTYSYIVNNNICTLVGIKAYWAFVLGPLYRVCIMLCISRAHVTKACILAHCNLCWVWIMKVTHGGLFIPLYELFEWIWTTCRTWDFVILYLFKWDILVVDGFPNFVCWAWVGRYFIATKCICCMHAWKGCNIV